MAAREGEVGYDQLHHFVAAGTWDQQSAIEQDLHQRQRKIAVSAQLKRINKARGNSDEKTEPDESRHH